MNWIASLQKAIDYMESHLAEPITIEDIAKQAHVSPFHFQRTFSILTDSTVGDYLRRRRLTKAAQELTQTDKKIIDIAFAFGYETPESFSKAFRKQHGMTPTDARKNNGKLVCYNRLVIQVQLKGAEPMKYKIIKKEAFQVIGVKRTFSLENEENLRRIPKMWDDIHQDGTNDKLNRLNNGAIKGILGVCANAAHGNPTNSIDYWIATDYCGKVPAGWQSMQIPASKWAIFEVHGPMPDAMQMAWKQIYSEWFPSNSYEYAGTPELEVYTEDDPASPGLYSEIWIPLK
ncbi:effector binding domain-containing protein [Bacillus sp. 1P06AnD]|uniref:effector binding domain-containing protein n=1 Tax=Bacillus sp. 1P06AnD TaxID=3132208 RepID=UPI0039A15952